MRALCFGLRNLAQEQRYLSSRAMMPPCFQCTRSEQRIVLVHRSLRFRKVSVGP